MTPGATTEDGAEPNGNRRLGLYTYLVNFFDLVLFWTGDVFASYTIVMPLFVSRLTDSTLAIGLVPTLYTLGYVAPQLLTARYIQRKRLKKGIAVRAYGIQRASLFLIAAACFVLGPDQPAALLAVFFVLFTVGWFGIGVGIPAHQDVVAKVVPVEARGRLRGTAIFVASLLGIGGGLLIRRILEYYPFPTGFAVLFLIAGAFAALSLLFVASNREPAAEVVAAGPSLAEYFRQLWATLQTDRNFGQFLMSRTIFGLSGMALPFIAIYAISRFGLPDSELGSFTAAVMAGQMGSVLLLGFVADRFGHRAVLQLGGGGLALALAFALVAMSPLAMLATFALVGVANAAIQVSAIYIVFEFAPTEKRPTYIALASTVTAPTAAIAPLLGGWIATLLGYPMLLGLSLVAALVGIGWLTLGVREPRRLKRQA